MSKKKGIVDEMEDALQEIADMIFDDFKPATEAKESSNEDGNSGTNDVRQSTKRVGNTFIADKKKGKTKLPGNGGPGGNSAGNVEASKPNEKPDDEKPEDKPDDE